MSFLSRTSTQTTASCAAPYKDARHLRSALSPGRMTLMLAAASATEGASFRHPRIRVSAAAPAPSCQDGPDTHPSPGRDGVSLMQVLRVGISGGRIGSQFYDQVCFVPKADILRSLRRGAQSEVHVSPFSPTTAPHRGFRGRRAVLVINACA